MGRGHPPSSARGKADISQPWQGTIGFGEEGFVKAALTCGTCVYVHWLPVETSGDTNGKKASFKSSLMLST